MAEYYRAVKDFLTEAQATVIKTKETLDCFRQSLVKHRQKKLNQT